MSIQRAQVNCKRGYALTHDRLLNDHGKFKSDSLYSARNEAMRALEAKVQILSSVYQNLMELSKDEKDSSRTTKGLEIVSRDVQKVNRALDACAECDYSSPKIVELTK